MMASFTSTAPPRAGSPGTPSRDVAVDDDGDAARSSMSRSMLLETSAGVRVELEIGARGELRHELAALLAPPAPLPVGAAYDVVFDVIEGHIPVPERAAGGSGSGGGMFGSASALFGATAGDGSFSFRLRDIGVVLHFFDGADFSGGGSGDARQHSRSIEVVLHHARLALTDDTRTPLGAAAAAAKLRRGAPRTPTVELVVEDISVYDRIEASRLNRLIGCWVDEARHPRETGAHALQLRFGAEPAAAGDGEGRAYDLDVRVLPLRLNFGGTTLDFARALLARVAAAEARDGGAAREAAAPRATDIAAPPPPPLFFRRVCIDALPVKLDFTPQRTSVSYKKLRSGDAVELASLVPLEGLELMLCAVDVRAVSGIAQTFELAASSWVDDVVAGQLHRCVAGVGAWPVQGIAGAIDLAAGAANLVLLPLAQYRGGGAGGRESGGGGGGGEGGGGGARGEQHRRGGAATAGLGRAATSFARAATLHVLNAAALVSRAAAETIDTAERTLVGEGSCGRRAATMSDALVAGTTRPAGFAAALSTACDVLGRQLHHTVYTVVAIPVREIRRGSGTGAVASVIRAVPVAVLHPLLGASDAMSALLLGARNSLDPAALADAQQKFKP